MARRGGAVSRLPLQRDASLRAAGPSGPALVKTMRSCAKIADDVAYAFTGGAVGQPAADALVLVRDLSRGTVVVIKFDDAWYVAVVASSDGKGSAKVLYADGDPDDTIYDRGHKLDDDAHQLRARPATPTSRASSR